MKNLCLILLITIYTFTCFYYKTLGIFSVYIGYAVGLTAGLISSNKRSK